MRIDTEGDASQRFDLGAWEAQIAAMHASVSRMTTDAKIATDQHDLSGPIAGRAEALRAQVFSLREGQMSAQDGLGHLRVAAADLQRTQDVLQRMRAVAAQAVEEERTVEPPRRAALQNMLDRSVQDLEGAAEQARYHTLKMLGDTASTWALPEEAAARAVVPATAGPNPFAGHGAFVGPNPFVRSGDGQRVNGMIPDSAEPREPRSSVAGPGMPRDTATGAFTARTPIATSDQARELVGRIDTASDMLARVGAAVDAGEQSLLRTIAELGLDRVRLSGDGEASPVAPGSVLPRLALQAAAQSSAAVLVATTRAQFDATRTILGGAAAAAAIGTHAASPARDASMAARPSVEPVSTGTRSSRAETSRERGGRGGSGSGVAGR